MKNLRKCKFKQTLDEEHTEYTPEEITAFRFKNSNLYASIEYDLKGEVKRYFIEQLIDGIVDVFYYSAKGDSFFLIRNEEGEIFELKNTQIEIESENGKYLKYKKEYVNVLRVLFRDSPSTLNKVGALQFNPNSMIEIAQDYHNQVCTEYQCVVYTKEKSGLKVGIGLQGGYSVSTIELYDNENTKNLNKDFSSSHDLVFGGYLNFKDPNISERFSVQLEFLFTKGSYSADSSFFAISYLKTPFLLNYTYPMKKIEPSVNFGVTYNQWLSFEDDDIVPDHLSGDAIQKKRSQLGIAMGFGISHILIKNIDCFIQVKYERYYGKHLNKWSKPGLTVQDFVKSKTNFMSCSLGVKF